MAAEIQALTVTKRCTVCGRFRSYDLEDRFCVNCGQEGLESECECGRRYDYAVIEHGPMFCPRCGRAFHGRAAEYE